MTSVTSEHALQTEHNHNVEKLSFKCIISKYRLDFKQSVAFEIMSCSFILKSLKVHNISDDTLYQFFEEILAGINFPVHFFKLLQVLVIYSSHAHGCLLGSVERYLIKCYTNFSTEFVEHN